MNEDIKNDIVGAIGCIRRDLSAVLEQVRDKPERVQEWPCGHRTVLVDADLEARAYKTFYGDDDQPINPTTCPVCGEAAALRKKLDDSDQALRNAEMLLTEGSRREAALTSQFAVRQSSDARVDRLVGLLEKMVDRWVVGL